MVSHISDEEFQKIVTEAIDDIPKKYLDRLQDVAFIVEDDPTHQQKQKQGLNQYQTLLGLYEGVPLPGRFGQTKILPDKITIFKNPLIMVSSDKVALKDNIRHTIWHEVAHYFGLDHGMIDDLDEKRSG